MRTILRVVTFIAVTILYQVIAYAIVKIAAPLVTMLPPYSFVWEGYTRIFMHVVLGVVALALSLYSYPVDLDFKHKNRGNKND